MDEKNKLTDEQLAGVSGGKVRTSNGLTLDTENPGTYLAFAEAERSTGNFGDFETQSWDDYLNWYINYYGETHPGDWR